MDAVSDAAEPAGDPTRDRLLAAAAEVFAEKGYDGAGVQDIARRAGFTTGAIYGRFRGKADLLLAAMEANTHDEFEELFAEHRFEGRVTDILTTVGSHLVTEDFDSGQALLLEAFVAGRRDPEVAAMLRRAIDEQALLTAFVEEAKSTGAIDPELDTLSIVRFCHAVALGFLLFGAIDLDRPDPGPNRRPGQRAEARRRILEAATEVFIETGPITASLDVIAERAGVSKASVFFHFGSRVELMAALARHLYLRAFPSERQRPHRTGVEAFLRAYLGEQRRPEIRLIWQLGDLLAADRPEGLDAAYWHLVREIEERLMDAGIAATAASERALVLAPALMLVARRAGLRPAPQPPRSAFLAPPPPPGAGPRGR